MINDASTPSTSTPFLPYLCSLMLRNDSVSGVFSLNLILQILEIPIIFLFSLSLFLSSKIDF